MTTATHPLATRNGIDAIVRIIEAQQIWRGATKLQRDLLAELCEPVWRAAIAVGALRDDMLPELPKYTKNVTYRSLRRKGLVDGWGRVTPRAVHAYRWAAWEPPPAVIDVELPEQDVTP